jgi:hypothetical protein
VIATEIAGRELEKRHFSTPCSAEFQRQLLHSLSAGKAAYDLAGFRRDAGLHITKSQQFRDRHDQRQRHD